MKLLRALVWFLLFAFSLLAIYGLAANHLFSQKIWHHVGIARLVEFSLGFALLAGAIVWWRRKLLFPVACGLAAAYSVFVVGAAPVGAVLLVLASGYSLGTLAWPRGTALIRLALGLACWTTLVFWTAWFPVHYTAVYVVALAVPVALNRRDLARRWRSALRPSKAGSGRVEALALALLLYTLAVHWLMALKPEVSGDALAMHLVIPSQVAYRHYWPFDFHKFVWAVMPIAGDWAFTLAYLPGGEFGARLLNFSFLAALAAGIVAALKGRTPRTVGYLAAALFVSTPLVQMETGSLMVENFWALILLASLLAIDRMEDDPHPGWLMVAALLAGFGLSIKFGSLSFSLTLLVIALLRFRKTAAEHRGRWMALAGGCFLLVALWPYVNAWRLTASPVFPYFNGLFKSPFYDPANFIDKRFRSGLSWRTLYDVTFHSSRFLEGQAGAFGFQWFWLLPVTAVALVGARLKLARAALAMALTGWVVTFSGQSYLRYIFPALAPLTLVLALGWTRLREIDRRLWAIVSAMVVGITLLNVYFVSSSSWYHKDFLLNPFRPAEKWAYLAESAPSRALVDRINHGGEEDPQVAFLNDNAIGELRGTAWASSWHNFVFMRQLYVPMSLAADVLEFFNRHGITWYITYTDRSINPLAQPPENIDLYRFLNIFTNKVAESGSSGLWRLKDEFRHPTREQVYRAFHDSLSAVGPGFYDDASESLAFYGPWTADHNFAEPINHSVTFCDSNRCWFEFRFRGTRLTWYYTAAPNRGRGSISIDGEERTMDEYAPRVGWRQKRTFTVPAGEHRAVVRVLGEKSPASAGCFLDLDGFQVE